MNSSPNSAAEALRWIKGAVRSGRFLMARHFVERCAERKVTQMDAIEAVRLAGSCEPYSAPPRQGGTCWRVHGRTGAGRRLGVGVEAFAEAGEQVILVTVFDDRRG